MSSSATSAMSGTVDGTCSGGLPQLCSSSLKAGRHASPLPESSASSSTLIAFGTSRSRAARRASSAVGFGGRPPSRPDRRRAACLRWCGFIDARREHRTVYNRIADERVIAMLDLAHALLEDHEENVAACCRIDEA